MNVVLISALLLGCAYANNQYANVKSVKGGHNGFIYNPANYPSFGVYGTRINSTQNSFGAESLSQYGNSAKNTSRRIDYEVGVCYIEVPTADLARGLPFVPAGNGSRPDFSRIRTCCKGYTRNMHNFRICDPVCKEDCINALCTAPDVCTCFPDHIKNLAGFCIPTCPIGCQNGHCSGGECLCKEGYQLDSDGKFCVPICRESCGGFGNCTEPNICQCQQGYQPTPSGNCKPICDRCVNGECIAPNDCRCSPGYSKDQQGQCQPQCPQGCGPNGICISPNNCNYPSTRTIPTESQVTTNPYKVYPENYFHPGCQRLPVSQVFPGHQIYQGYDHVAVCPNNQPECSQPCINGVCIGDNKCRCNAGYILDTSVPNRCLPHCPSGCPNGICSAPNFCICIAGYYKDTSVKGRSACVKRT